VEEAGQNRDVTHLITANEGNAVATAMGYHLATGQLPLVYMQNSGLGNAVNPLASLAHPDVYGIPMLLMIGWRGEPGTRDEPQHVHQGRMTISQLDALQIPHVVLDAKTDLQALMDQIFGSGELTSPFAMVVRKDAFETYQSTVSHSPLSALGREEAIGHILDLCDPQDLIVSTTGKTSRELFEWRQQRGQPQRDFLTVGGMGHTASIALGVCMGAPQRRVICLDGDGSLLMHMGSLPVIASMRPRRFVHVLLNNGAHESVGGQATVARNFSLSKLASSAGYAATRSVSSLAYLRAAWRELAALSDGPVLIEIQLSCGSRSDLGRPTSSARANKHAFMEAVRQPA
jgi:phosphonopyruvate decarboxylase